MYDQSCHDLAVSFLSDQTEKKWNAQTSTQLAQEIQTAIEDFIDDLPDEDLDDEKDEAVVDRILKPLMNEEDESAK